MRYALLLLAFLAGCAATTAVSTSPIPQANGGLGFIRSAGIIGIGAMVFLTCLNSGMKILIAAMFGMGTTTAFAITCRYYEKQFALVVFIALTMGLLGLVASLFVKHKGIFLAWRQK